MFTLRKSVVCVVGTRPEAIKMAPVILRLRRSAGARVSVLATGQHRELLDTALDLFGITPDSDLSVMTQNQTLPQLTSRLIVALDAFLESAEPEIVLVQGDTTSAMVAGLACFYRGIPVGHVEAGLRTHNLRNPFPEELNRVMLSRLATWHFCPTERNRRELAREGIEENVYVTGNTVIDALRIVAAKSDAVDLPIDASKRLILATIHRRESIGDPMRQIAVALRMLATKYTDIQIVIPVHPNPSVGNAIRGELADVANVILCEPLGYGALVALLKRCFFVISDSGGIQEEAPALSKPVLVVRDETERLEAIEAGVAKLVGTETSSIVSAAEDLLDNEAAYRAMARGVSPYGDGMAAARIAEILGFGHALCMSCDPR